MSLKLIITGGVAGGATAAARARRLNEQAEIILFERGEHISFANCGLPYFIGQQIKKREDLLVTTPEAFKERYNIDIRTFSEVVSIDRLKKQVEVKDVKTGDVYSESYDKIILAPGAEPLRPPIDGINLDNIYSLRNIPDTDRIKNCVDLKGPDSAVIVGGGFIGLEMAENLAIRGVNITIVEMLDQVMAPIDFEMAALVHTHLKDEGVKLELGNGVKGFTQAGGKINVSTDKGPNIQCDMVILSIGIRPESALARNAGLDIGERGGIKVNSMMQTSDPDIYAVGDAIETVDFITGQPAMTALAGPANKQGRIAADNVMGRKTVFKGTIGSAIAKVFDLTVASTGLSEKVLKKNGTTYRISFTCSGSHASYYPGAEMLTIKLIFSPGNGEILGAQIVGKKGVDKRIDIIATAIHASMTVQDLEELELAYAPPYSSAKDPVNIAGFVAANLIKHDVESIYWNDMDKVDKNEYVFIDLRLKSEIALEGAIEGSIHIPIDNLRESLGKLDRSKKYILICAVGLRSYIAYRILKQNGFMAKSFNGGYDLYKHAIQ